MPFLARASQWWWHSWLPATMMAQLLLPVHVRAATTCFLPELRPAAPLICQPYTVRARHLRVETACTAGRAVVRVCKAVLEEGTKRKNGHRMCPRRRLVWHAHFLARRAVAACSAPDGRCVRVVPPVWVCRFTKMWPAPCVATARASRRRPAAAPLTVVALKSLSARRGTHPNAATVPAAAMTTR